jgi:hypothetical protein
VCADGKAIWLARSDVAALRVCAVSGACRFEEPILEEDRFAMKHLNLVLAATAIGGIAIGALSAAADPHESDALIADAMRAAPASISEKAAIKDGAGNVLRPGENGWTCYPGSHMMGPACNQPQWDAVMQAMMGKTPIDVKKFSVSYMLAGDGDAAGASNIDPYATEPTPSNQWIKEGPHVMIVVPDAKMLEGLSTDPKDPVHVMWKGTPYAHIMLRIADE